MKREIAEQIAEAMHGVDVAIDRLGTVVQAVEDETVRKKMLRSIGMAILDLHEQVTLSVVREHQDLHPDRPLQPPAT